MIRVLLKWLLMGMLIGLLLVALAASAVAIVMNTESGTRWAMARIAAATPGELDLGEFEGTLWRGLRFVNPRYAINDNVIEATDLRVEVGWLSSAIGNLQLERLNASTLRITAPSSAEESPPGLDVPPAPLTIRLVSASIDRLQIDRDGRLTEIADIRLRGVRYADVTVTAATLALVYDELAVQGNAARLRLSGDAPLRGGVAWQLTDRGWSGQGSLDGSLAAIRFEQTVSGPLPSAVNGELLLLGRDEPLLDLQVRWDTWTFDSVEIINGQAHATGTIDAYEIVDASAVVVAGERRIGIVGKGRGNRDALDTFDADFDIVLPGAEPIAATASGRVAWQPDIVAEAQFTADTVYADKPVAARGNLRYVRQSIRCDACTLRSGPNSVDLDGTLTGDEVAASMLLDVPQLGDILPGYFGAVTGRVNLRTSASGPRIDFDLAGNQLGADRWPDYRIDSTTRGTARSDNDAFSARIAGATISEATIGAWALDDGLNARWSDGMLEVSPHAWLGDVGALNIATLSYSESRFRIAAGMDGVSLGRLNNRLPPNMQLAGTANARADLERVDDNWSGSFSWDQQGTTLTVTEITDETTKIIVPEARSNIVLRDGGITADAALTIEPAARATVHVELAGLDRESPMQAELRLQGDDFTWLSALVPTIDRVDGVVAAEIFAEGQANAPTIRGSATWRDGSLLLPALNVPLEDINVEVSGGSVGNLRVAGGARAGDGRLVLSGELQDLMSASRTFVLTITGTDAELVNWPEYRLWATPDVRITGRGGNWRYTGQVDVPRAEVRLRELPTDAVTVSSDVVVTGEEIPEQEPIRWSGDARVVLGDQVRFRALGLDTRLTGNLRVRAQLDRPLALNGTVSLVDGSFEAYGQKLTIREGQLTFTGPVDDPLVDVRAVRVIDTFDGTVTAGLHVHGRAQELTSTVFSEPAMPDADALSYLVIGRPLNEATQAEGGDLSGAALALGLKQATRLTQQIGQSVGLDQLAVTGDGGETTALVAGKQINSRLYARYAYGVFSRIGVLLLRYRLTPNLTLEAGAGETQSIDIMYSIERD